MYNKEARHIIKALDIAISNITNAQGVIKRSQTQTSADLEVFNTLFNKASEIRDIKKMVKAMYAGMDD